MIPIHTKELKPGVALITGGAKRIGKEISKNLAYDGWKVCLLYTSPSPRDRTRSRMPSSA